MGSRVVVGGLSSVALGPLSRASSDCEIASGRLYRRGASRGSRRLAAKDFAKGSFLRTEPQYPTKRGVSSTFKHSSRHLRLLAGIRLTHLVLLSFILRFQEC